MAFLAITKALFVMAYFCRAGIHVGSVLANGDIGACPNIHRDLFREIFIKTIFLMFGITVSKYIVIVSHLKPACVKIAICGSGAAETACIFTSLAIRTRWNAITESYILMNLNN